MAFKLGEMFVSFFGKDMGLKQAMKTAESLGKVTGKVLEKAVKEGAKMGVAGAKAFATVGVAASKAAAVVSKSFQRISSDGIKAAAKIVPAFLRSFDQITKGISKLSVQAMKSFGQIGKEGAKALGKGLGGGIGSMFKGMGGGMSGLAAGVSGAAKSIVGGFTAIGTAATATFTAITYGAAAVIAAVAGIAAVIGVTTSMASSAQEMQGKFDVVFGASAPKATAEISKLATAMGRSHNDLKEMASGVQDLLVPLGFARDKAAGMSVKISQLAVDMASFGNKTDAEAMDDIQSAMAGSGEVMKKYGVIINEVTLKQELARMGYKGVTEDAGEQMKTLARLNLIIAGTSDAHGDAVRTGGSFANQMKRIMGLVKDIGINIGRIFLPAAETFAAFFSDNLQLISENSESLEMYGDIVKGWAEVVVTWFQRAIAVVVNWKDISTNAFNVVAAVTRTSLDVIITMLDNVETFLLNMFGHVIDFFPNLLTTIAEQHGTLWDFLKKGWGDFWEYVWSGGTDGNDIDFGKLAKGMADKMKSLPYKPLDTSEAINEWNRFLTVVDSKLAEKIALPKLDAIDKFNAADLGVKTPAGKTIKFEMVNASDLFKKTLDDAFDKEKTEEQVKATEKVVEEVKEGVKVQEKIKEGIDLLNSNFEKFSLIA